MKEPIVKIALGAVAIWVAALCVVAAKEAGSLEVHVTADGRAAESAVVELDRGTARIAVNTKDGTAFFGNFPIGDYTLRTRADGFAPQETAVTIEKSVTKTVTVKLVPEASRPTTGR